MGGSCVREIIRVSFEDLAIEMLRGRYCYHIVKEIKAVVPQLTCDSCTICCIKGGVTVRNYYHSGLLKIYSLIADCLKI